jgi:hypothetical protein
MAIFSALAKKYKDTVASLSDRMASSLTSFEYKTDKALDAQLAKRGIVDVAGKTIVKPEAVIQKRKEVTAGKDAVTGLQKGTSSVLPLPYKASQMPEAVRAKEPIKVVTQPS